MRSSSITVLTFVLATIVGFLAIAGGYLAYAISTDYPDREGATGMAVIFIEAPLGGLVIGFVCALVTAKMLRRRNP
jgi:hypothetical protein